MPLIHKVDHPWVEGVRLGRVGPKGSYRINTSCIAYRLGETLIDTGPGREWHGMKGFLEEKPLRQVLLTHYHEDHSGNCGNIQDAFNPAIWAHKNTQQRLIDGVDVNLISRYLFGKVSKPQKHTYNFNSYNNAIFELEDGMKLQAIHLPGHSDDLTCLYEENRGWLFAGDLYVASNTRYSHHEENISQFIQSLDHAISLDFDELFCSHRGPMKNGKQALINKRDYFVSLREQVLDLNKKGLSSRAITKKLLGMEDTVAFSSLFKMSKHHLIKACLKESKEPLL